MAPGASGAVVGRDGWLCALGAGLVCRVGLFGCCSVVGADQRHVAELTLPILIAARYLAFILAGLYRSIWRFAGSRDLAAIGVAAIASEAVAAGYVGLSNGFGDFSRSFFLIDAVFAATLIAASRFGQRALVARPMRMGAQRRSLIVGAGRTGRSLMRELRETPGERVVGFVDDNPRLRRRRLHGIPVVGGTHELPALLARHEADILFVTIPDAPRERLDAVVAACADADVVCRFVRREIDLEPSVVLRGSLAE